MRDKSTVKAWHVAPWPPLAWLETAIKLVATGTGIVALAQALSSGAFGLPTGARLVQLIVLAILSLGLVAAIADRFTGREIVAIVFVLLNNVRHWGMVVALAGVPGPGWMLAAFAALMLAGDVVKLVFINVHDFSQRDIPRVALYGMTPVHALGYLLILLLELVR